MILNPKNKKVVHAVWTVVGVLVVISMVAFYTLPFLTR